MDQTGINAETLENGKGFPATGIFPPRAAEGNCAAANRGMTGEMSLYVDGELISSRWEKGRLRLDPERVSGQASKCLPRSDMVD